MGSVKVSVYGRLKPRPKNVACQDYKLKYGDHEDQITFTAKGGAKKVYRFKKIFAEDVTQKQIFDAVAKPMLDNFFEGYNGTIFTYGQTGSGKTHTMTGSLEDWVQTGLIPRALTEIFKMKENGTTVTIAYFEIYNEHIYDLIRRDRINNVNTTGSQHFVDENNMNIRNLSVHTVTSANHALQLFKRGDTNKMMAETNSNARSSRSHVIFSIGLEFPHPKEELINLKPVLYLVDLAGSERISKCKNPMSNPWETRNINLSLHYLEQVLIALRQPGRAHIPYRNSLMTALLRNSLGGNCITRMIATFSISINDTEETIQTCKFSERIALIKNEVKLSGLTSPQREIEVLRKENELLKTQLKLLSTKQLQNQLNEKEKEKCCEMVHNFISDNDFFALPLTDIRRMQFCFQLMRDEILDKKPVAHKEPAPIESKKDSSSDRVGAVKSKILNNLVQQNITSPESKPKEFEKPKENCFLKPRQIDKIFRRKRHPLELPKINITYLLKKWRSTELLPEKENTAPKEDSRKVPETGVESLSEVYSEQLQATFDLFKKQNQGSDVQICQSPTNVCSSARHQAMYVSSATQCDSLLKPLRRSGIFIRKFPSDMKSDTFNSSIISSKSSTLSKKRAQHKFLDPPLNSENIKTMNKVFSYNGSSKTESLKLEDLGLKRYFIGHSSNYLPLNGLPLTGDKEVDEEIIKFYQSRIRALNGS